MNSGILVRLFARSVAVSLFVQRANITVQGTIKVQEFIRPSSMKVTHYVYDVDN